MNKFVHTKSHTGSKFKKKIGAVMHERDCSCAPILQFFSAASDGAAVEHQIHKHVYRHFCRHLKGIASPFMNRFGRSFRHLLEHWTAITTH